MLSLAKGNFMTLNLCFI